MIVEAVRIFHLRRSVNGAALMRQVSICRVEKDMRPYLSAILVMAAGEAWEGVTRLNRPIGSPS